MIHFRDYQTACEESIFQAWQKHTSVLAVLATGLGKTVIAANIIKRMHPGRTMFIAHREELIFQAHDKISRGSDLGCEIEMADIFAGATLFSQQDVVVSTVQTQTSGVNGGRMSRFNPNDFTLLVIDEAHHATADSYRRVIEHYRKNPNLKILGLTATPKRADEEALGQIFEHVAFNFGIEEGIADGWLVPVEQQIVRIKDIDFSKVRTTAGDLNGADLAKVMEAEKAMQGVAGSSMELIGTRKALVFTASVKQAEQLCEIYNRHKPGCAEWVCGMTEKKDRRSMLSRYASGKIQIIVNVGVATEGFDEPTIQVVVIARPTKSLALYMQMIGRGTRPLPGVVDGDNLDWAPDRKESIAKSAKPKVEVIDYTGNSGRHKLITMTDVLGGNYTEEERERADQMLEEGSSSKNVQAVLLDAKALLQKEKDEEARKEKERQEQATRARLLAQVQYQARKVNPFDGQDTFQHDGGVARSRDGKQFSDKQTAILRRAGVPPESVHYMQGQAIIGKYLSKPSDKQLAVLRRAGYSPEELTKLDGPRAASALIDKVKANGWKRVTPAAQPEMTVVDF